ncbi:CDP-alcohol phosphatidyltransferase family protein [Microbacterium tumbae]
MTVRESIRALREAQKSSSGAPAYSRFVNRPLGRVFAAVAHAIGMTPDQVTAVSAVCTFAGIAVIALVPPTLLSSLIVVALLVLGYALDSADGQLARLRGGGSPRGEWLDHMVDATKMSSIHLAVLVCWARFSEIDPGWLLVPIGFTLVSTVFFFGVILSDLIRRTSGTGPREWSARAQQVRTSPLFALAVLPADYGLLMLVLVTLWLPTVFLVLYTALLAVNLLILIASLVRWYRSLPAEASHA